ncbi:SigE family RNA polymerase sigma factor [Planotetraspora sp. A-T 1434]|uniref:SigE family RNA polymerase sigma factor n=1 Tax=Planotetraspora sp. A-T 1434 TaxID=2979219 RepID=UPI0021C01B04|nr:SigE family RNA polymerase sigma factor [Planotetraspora sp. A-T 1434]MCT9933221.1 SigE family RNA polymerase sigma factor [Planotetraspora sp. A-T 1434]
MAEACRDEFARFVKEVRPALRRTAFQLSDDWYEADDLVQRTLMAIHRHWDTIEERDKIAAYARTIMTRLLISDRRSLRWSREILNDLPPEPEPTPDPYALLGDRMVLMDALAGLAPRQRAAVILRYWEDRSVEETARAMGSRSSTVRSQTVRALATLRSALEAEGDGNAEDAPDEQISGPCGEPELN